MINNITFGSDPEYFIVNKDTEMIISSIGLINGTKKDPEPLGDDFFVLKDNILAEGNIPPASDPIKFMHNLMELKTRILKYLHNIDGSLSLKHSDCLNINPMFLTDPEALEFGCSPYLNAWDHETHKANDLSSVNYRTAGFHLHFGYSLDSHNPYRKNLFNRIIAKAFDIFVVIPSMFKYVDKRRFENYGGLGQFRHTSYGVECRSLGAYFVHEKYLPWVIDQSCKALSFVKKHSNCDALLTLEKPTVKFLENGNFTFDSSIYDDLEISLNEQLIYEKEKIYAHT